jgi:hypothetical protein
VFFVALFFLVLLWATAVEVARGNWKSLALFLVLWPLAIVGMAPASLLIPSLVVQFVAQAIILLFIRVARVRSVRSIMRLTLAGVLITCVITGWFVARQQQEFQRLRELYPFESMEERVPEPVVVGPRQPLPGATEARLAKWESAANRYPAGWSRPEDLKMLHRKTVRLFINSPGFGVARAIDLPSKYDLDGSMWDKGPIRQPVPRASPSAIPAGLTPAPLPVADVKYGDLHLESVGQFAYPDQFGLVEDRRHVAGFLPHSFHHLPWQYEERIKVETIDLVGLLLNPEPVAYVSADLPRMDELRKAPTRPLDEFESAGLQQLRDGEDLVGAESGEYVRMLGAVRNAKHCATCHGGERGDLLGAFSYVVRRVKVDVSGSPALKDGSTPAGAASPINGATGRPGSDQTKQTAAPFRGLSR